MHDHDVFECGYNKIDFSYCENEVGFGNMVTNEAQQQDYEPIQHAAFTKQ